MLVQRELGTSIRNKIVQKEATVCVIGLGQVGLPTAIAFLRAGFLVLGYDVSKRLIHELKVGFCRISENGFGKEVHQFIKKKSFIVSNSEGILVKADVYIICVPTPLRPSSKKADLEFLGNALRSISEHLSREKLVVVESTLPPKSMKEHVIPMLERLSGKKAGSDFLVSFCPERIVPGASMEELVRNSRIIGSNDDASFRASLSLYKNVTNGEIYRSDTTTAEIAKVAENSYRDINIAFANELAVICEELDSDVSDVIRLANTHPRVKILKPGPGVGGPCLPKDPYLLLASTKFDKRSIVRIARSINDSMPERVMRVIKKALSLRGLTSKDISILVLGSSYKPEVADSRNSPAQKVISGLKEEGFRNIRVHDPYSNESFGAKQVMSLHPALVSADCVVILTGHRLYFSLRPKDFKRRAVLVDTVRVLNKKDYHGTDIIYCSIGSQPRKY